MNYLILNMVLRDASASKNSLVLFQSCPELFGKTGSEAIYKVEQCEEREGGGEETGKERAELFPLSTKRRYIRPVQGSPLS